MDVSTIRELFGRVVLWGCLGSFAALVLFGVGLGLSRLPGLVGAVAKRHGWFRILVFACLSVVLGIFASSKHGGDSDGAGDSDADGDGGTNTEEMVGMDLGDAGTNDTMFAAFGLPLNIEGLGGLSLVESVDMPVTLSMEEEAAFGPVTSTNTARQLTDEDFRRGFVLTRVGTGESFDFSAPSNAEVCADWRSFGAAEDWTYLECRMRNDECRIGTNTFDRLRVYSFGKADLLVTNEAGRIVTGNWLSPFKASLGIVPEANWNLLGGDASTNSSSTNSSFFIPHSSFWSCTTPSNTLQLTWQNALLERETNAPVSFQAELGPSGRFIFRYDLSQCGGRGATALPCGAVTNILVGASCNDNAWTTNALATNVTSLAFAPLTAEDAVNPDRDGDGIPTIDELFVYNTDPANADSDHDGLSDSDELFAYNTDPLDPHTRSAALCDGFAVKIGDVDPFSCPEGSTNTVFEHVFYSGTTNGVFAYPQSSGSSAVLRVSVSGTGSGELVVGSTVVPLIAPTSDASTLASTEGGGGSFGTQLLVQVARGEDVRLYLRGDGTLSLALDSDDFAFGTLPSLSVGSVVGFVNFPNTVAETPCIHDFNSRRKSISLPVASGAEALCCTWTGSNGVEVENVPPRSAKVTGSFNARATGGVAYTLSHPLYLFGQTTYAQTVRFCPHPSDADPDDPAADDPSWYEEGEGDDSSSNSSEHEERWCCFWGTCCDGDGSCFCGCEDESCCGGGDAEEDDGDFDDDCPQHGVPYAQCASLHAADYTNAVQNVEHLGGVLYIRDPLRYEQIDLDVPTERRNCCPCPDHWTNYVAVTYKSYRLNLVDAGGLPFSRTETSCAVRLAGCHPSSSVGDAELAFARNGEIYRRYAKTVLGVGIESPDVDLNLLDSLAPAFGLPMTVCTNVTSAPALRLVTNVRLPAGNIHLELDGATSPFTVWYIDRRTWTYRRLLDSATAPVKDLSLACWKKLMRRASDGNSAEMPIIVTSSSPGSVRLVFRYWGVVDGRFVEDEACQKITSINPALLPDLNYDGNIDDEDTALFLAGHKFRFWQNEDTIKGSYNGQMGDGGMNVDDAVVNGAYDLVNFFPMAVNFTPLLDAWGNRVTYHLEPEWPDADSFNFLWADIGKTGYRRMQSETLTDIWGTALEEASVINLMASGYNIPSAVMDMISEGDGMIVAEAKASYVSMKFSVRYGDDVIFAYVAPLSISRIRDMYRWINIRTAAGDSSGEDSSIYIPWNRPDSECDNRHFVFVHGYNVNASQARLWANGICKRLWWSGSHSRFTAVDWYGDDSQLANYVSPNYYINVEHALVSAPALVAQCENLEGEKTFIAHSLGNMLVSSAAKEHGLSYSKYYMVDAAVAMECYAQNSMTNNMVEHGWTDVPSRLWSANWYRLFIPSDDRSNLCWRARFQGLANVINCYSPSEDVLGNATPNGWGGAWSMQELFKGTATLHVTPGNCEGGWGYNDEYTNLFGLLKDDVKTNSYSVVQLIQSPIFRPFDDDDLHSTNLVSLTLMQKAKVLSDGIPAVSFASGANLFGETAGIANVNMTDYAQDWPRESGAWLHSDINNVAYKFMSGLFDMIVSESLEEE